MTQRESAARVDDRGTENKEDEIVRARMEERVKEQEKLARRGYINMITDAMSQIAGLAGP